MGQRLHMYFLSIPELIFLFVCSKEYNVGQCAFYKKSYD